MSTPGKGVTGIPTAISPTFADTRATYGVSIVVALFTGCTGTVSMKIMVNCGSSNATLALHMMNKGFSDKEVWSIGCGEEVWGIGCGENE